MKNKRLFTLFSITLIFVFITSLVSTVNVLADDSTPPAPTEEPVLPPTEEPAAETEPAPTSAPEADTPAEILESAPEGVDVVVLDENGEPMSLVTEEAAQVIMAGDPMWCPDGITPGNDMDDAVQDCTNPYPNDFAGLVADLADGGYSGSGTIYVAYDYSASEGQIDILHSNGSLSDLDNLVIQGGWDFTNDVLCDDISCDSQSTLNGTWLYIDWVGNVTVNNIFIDNAGGTGLYIDAEGDVALNYVDINNSDMNGAQIQSEGDVEVNNSDFTNNGFEGQTYSNFSTDPETGDDLYDEGYQAGDGLYIDADGNVTLMNVHAGNFDAGSGNAGNGAEIYSDGNVFISYSEFSDNGFGSGYGAENGYHEYDNGIDEFGYYILAIGGNGLYVSADGDITLNDLEADYNAGNGAYLNADGDIEITDSAFSDNGQFGYFEISNNYQFGVDEFYADFYLDYHAGDGLYAWADGDITLNEVFASGNANDGADLYSYDGDIEIINYFESNDPSFAGNGYGNGFFSDGDGYDLLYEFLIDTDFDTEINSFSDTAFCQMLDDSGNSYAPIVFNPCDDYNYIEVQGPNFHLDVEFGENDGDFYNYYFIEQSGGSGLEAQAYNGTITVENIDVIANADNGAYLEAGDDIEITDSFFVGNGSLGYLEVGECASSVGQFCYEHDELEVPVMADLAAILSFNYGNGVNADSGGNITISGIDAVSNYNYGAQFFANESIFVEESFFAGNGYMVELGGAGLFDDYLCDYVGLCSGLELPVSGFDLNIGFASDFADVTAVGVELDFGAGGGLLAVGNNVTLTEMCACGNLGDGVYAYAAGNLNVFDAGFYDNGDGFSGHVEVEYLETDDDGYIDLDVFITNGSGLVGVAGNDITLNEVDADGNALYGAELVSGAINSVFVENSQFYDNGYSEFLGIGIRLEGDLYDDGVEFDSDFGESYGSGLYIESAGNVTLIDVDAYNNYQDGAEVYSNGGRVIVSCGAYYDNGAYGIYEEDASSLELYGPEIYDNGYTPDEYFFSNSVVVSEDCTIPEDEKKETVVAGAPVCSGDAATATFFLPKGDFVVFPCPINDFAVVRPLAEKELPAVLAEGQKFLSSLSTKVMRDNASVEELEKPVIVSFLIPKDVDKETLAILFWNGTEWIDLGGEVSNDELYFEVSTNLVGTFVLVSK